MKRRNFIATSGCGVAGLFLNPSFASMIREEENVKNTSALNTRLNVKFVINGGIHEGAWEGSCRHGSPENLSYEAEKTWLDIAFNNFKKDLSSMQFFPEMEILEPVKTFTWIEEGNPDIMYSDNQLEKLAPDDSKTDVYVIMGGGLPQYPGFRIAEQFRKPVILANTAGWGIDMPAGIRNKGLEGYYVQNNEQLKDLLNLMFVRKAVANTKLLTVTNFKNNMPRGVVSTLTDLNILKEKYDLDYQYVNYEEFFKEMDNVEKDSNSLITARKIGEQLLKNARNSNMTLDDIVNSIQFYQTTLRFLERYSCNAFTIECFELCSSLNPWNRRFTPCLCHAMLKDTGYPSACEGDINALLAMMVQMYVSRKAAYMGNPDIDVENNRLTVHHSVASLKMNGFEEPETSYDIVSFTESGFGVTLRHDFNENLNRVMTVGRFSPSGDKMLITKGYVIGGVSGSGCGCEQRVTLQIPDGEEFFDRQQDFGHHLSLVYGDYTRQIKNLGKMMGFEVEAVI